MAHLYLSNVNYSSPFIARHPGTIKHCIGVPLVLSLVGNIKWRPERFEESSQRERESQRSYCATEIPGQQCTGSKKGISVLHPVKERPSSSPSSVILHWNLINLNCSKRWTNNSWKSDCHWPVLLGADRQRSKQAASSWLAILVGICTRWGNFFIARALLKRRDGKKRLLYSFKFFRILTIYHRFRTSSIRIVPPPLV